MGPRPLHPSATYYTRAGERAPRFGSVSVFSSVPEEVLADLAGFLDEIEVEEGDPVYEKEL